MYKLNTECHALAIMYDNGQPGEEEVCVKGADESTKPSSSTVEPNLLHQQRMSKAEKSIINEYKGVFKKCSGKY